MAAFVPFERTRAQFYDGFMTSAALAIALHFASTWTGRSLSTLPASEFRQKALRVCDGLRCSMKRPCVGLCKACMVLGKWIAYLAVVGTLLKAMEESYGAREAHFKTKRSEQSRAGIGSRWIVVPSWWRVCRNRTGSRSPAARHRIGSRDYSP